MNLRLYKFIIGGSFVTLPSNPSIAFKGCLAVALAESEEQAREIVKADGEDCRWLEVAQVRVIELTSPKLVAYAQV